MRPLLDETRDELERALLREARAYRASPAVRARALAAASGVPSWWRGTTMKVVLAAALAGAGASIWGGQRAAPIESAPPPDRPAAVTGVELGGGAAVSSPAPAATGVRATGATTGVAPGVTRSEPATTVGSAPERSTLAEEIALIDRVRKAVYAPDRAGAFLALEEYERRFPNGALAPEGRALRARAEALR